MNDGGRGEHRRSGRFDAEEIAAPIRPDATDTRDRWYERNFDPAALPLAVTPDEYRRYVGETWHQRGEECTGFALAAIANYSRRRQLDDPALPSVSRRMLYEVAQLHDGEEFQEGSTLRGALKGWSRTGVARDELWPYDPDDEFGTVHGDLTLARLLDARHRPLLGYRRIARVDITSIKDALASGHALFAAATLHVGWYRLFMPEVDSVIERRPGDAERGGHAIVIVGYDDRGLWIHNSWGPEWGVEGYGILPYDDWLAGGLDAWVVDVAHPSVGEGTRGEAPPQPSSPEIAAYRDIWPHLVVLRDDGRLASAGLFEMDEGSVKTLLFLFQERTADWQRRRLAVIFDSGHLTPAETIQRCRQLRDEYLARGVYPLFVVWETSWWAELVDELHTWTSRLSDRTDRIARLRPDDDLARAVAHASVLRPIWQEVLRRARRAVDPGGGLATLAEVIAKKRATVPFDLHLVSHGAGDVEQAALLRLLPAPITTVSALVPVTTESQARAHYAADLDDGRLGHVALVTLDAPTEAADSVGPIAGSLLSALGLFGDTGDGIDAPFGLGRLGADPWQRLSAAGRFEQAWVSGIGHAELMWDTELHRRLASMMSAHVDRGNTEPRAEPSVSSSAGVPATAMPTDPLAYSKALRKRRK
jgi:hypothetical protein